MIVHFMREQTRYASSFGNGLALLVLVAALSGCATSTKYRYDDEWKEQVSDFRIVDKRPTIEKKAEIMSSSLLSEKYGEYRLGDDQLVPERIAYLKGQMLSIDARRFAGKTAHLTHFEVFNKLGGAHRNAVSQWASNVAISSALAGRAADPVWAATTAGAVAPTPRNEPVGRTPAPDWPCVELFVEVIFDEKTYNSMQRTCYHALNQDADMRHPVQALKVSIRKAAQDLTAKAKKE